eukprot:2232048-Ditylum_brightwellii.AAC.1
MLNLRIDKIPEGTISIDFLEFVSLDREKLRYLILSFQVSHQGRATHVHSSLLAWTQINGKCIQ